MNKAALSPRPYRQSARAEAAAATHQRILESFLTRARTGWMDEITLEEIALAADVTVQTVIRRFGGKEGLLQAAAEQLGREIEARREIAPEGDWRGHVRAAIADYEITGDLVLRLLAQEERWPALQPVLARGRASHRDVTARLFRSWLGKLKARERAHCLAALVALTDVYTWKLLRRDQGLSLEATTDIVADLVGRLLDES